MAIDVRPVQPGSPDHEAVKRLRYEVYAAEEGLDIPGTDAAAGTLADALDAGSYILGAFDGDEAVASIRMTPFDELPADGGQRELFGSARFPLPESKMFVLGRLIVAAPRRGSSACMRLLTGIYAHAFRSGFEAAFLLCRPRQVAMYESVGCRGYRGVVGDAQFGLLVPMVHLLRDLEHAKRVPSKLFSADLGVTHNEALSSWFAHAFGAEARSRSVRPMDESKFSALARDLAACGCAPFAGLAPRDLRRLLKASAVIDVPAGTRILPQGSRGCELYALLGGEVVLAAEGAARPRFAVLLGPGQVFAEDGFLWDGLQPSSHEVIALKPARLLSINADALGESCCAKPEVVARFYRGLSRLLGERLQLLHGACGCAAGRGHGRAA